MATQSLVLVEIGRDNDATIGTLAARSGVSARRLAGIIDDPEAVVLLSRERSEVSRIRNVYCVNVDVLVPGMNVTVRTIVAVAVSASLAWIEGPSDTVIWANVVEPVDFLPQMR